MTDPTKIPIDPNTEHLTELGKSADLHLQAQMKTTDAIREIEPILEGALVKSAQANDTLKKIEENTSKNDSIEFSINGAESVMYKGEKGDKGETGEPGKTPEKGVDYFTPEDVQAVAAEAAGLVPPGKDGIDGVNGRDGLDGIHGKDGKNGKDGKDGTALDGDDGKDGRDGKDGSPDTGEQIVSKLEALPKGSRLSYDSLDDLPSFPTGRTASRDYDLRELKDVNIGTPTNGQVLTFDSATQKWISGTGGGSGTVTSVSVTTANGVSGSVLNPTTTPAITVSLGAITPTSVAASGTVTGSNLSGTNTGDQTNISGNAATVTTNANLTGPITSTGNATAIASQTGTGTKFVVDNTPTLITPVLGVATATSINKVALTAPATSATLTIADGKTLTSNNTLTLAGTDSTTMTFPSTSATIARTDAANTFTGVQTFSTPIATGSVATMTATVGGGVPTPPNNTSTFLRGDGTFAAPAGGGVPVGSITMYGASSAPTDWILCDGASLLRSGTYAALFAVLSTAYGSADGTHFNVPDLRGRVPIGVGTGTGGGASGTGLPTGGSALTARSNGSWLGEETHTQTEAELAAHSHTYAYDTSSANGGSFVGNSNNSHDSNGTTSTTGSSTPFNVIQPVMGVTFIIKYQ